MHLPRLDDNGCHFEVLIKIRQIGKPAGNQLFRLSQIAQSRFEKK